MTPERAELLAELLREMAEIDGGYVPPVAWEALHRYVPIPTCELLISRNNGREFLLTYREDQYWRGWHIPGSFNRKPESLEETCQRIAREEVGIEGVEGLHAIALCKWDEHPYGAPLSIVLVGQPVGIPIEKPGEMGWFDRIPSPIVTNHGKFLASYLNFLQNPVRRAELLVA